MSRLRDQLRQRIVFLESQRAGQVRETMERTLKAAAPVGKSVPFGTNSPGTLRDSCSVSVRFDGSARFTFTARAEAPHASYTNDGTNAFAFLVQRPQSPSGRRGAVRFWWGRSGNVEFRPTGWVIRNPGVQATHWFDNALGTFHDILEASG